MASESAEESLEVSSQYYKLPDTFKIPSGHAVCSKQEGNLEISDDAKSFLESYASNWSKISPFETSNPGSQMSVLIDGIICKGILIETIRRRCVHIKIQKTQNFGILNSLVSPFEAKDDVSISFEGPISFVYFIHEGSISRNLDKIIDVFVKILKQEEPSKCSSLSLNHFSSSSSSSSTSFSSSDSQQESSGLIDPVMTLPALSTAKMGKRKRSSVGLVSMDTKLEIAGLKSTITCLELQISGLQNQNNMYTCKNYELSIAMDILQELCLKKISTMESKSQSSEATEEIKKMVSLIYEYDSFEEIYECRRRAEEFLTSVD